MGRIQIDIGTFLVLQFLVIFLFSTIVFPFTKRNELLGIRVKQSFESEEIWHKIHVIASIATIPFDIILFILLFVESAIVKGILAFFITILIIYTYSIIPILSTRKYFKMKNEKEAKELEEQIKKESGWR